MIDLQSQFFVLFCRIIFQKYELFNECQKRGGDYMIRKNDAMLVELKERMRGGDGTIQIRHLFQQAELGGKCRLIAEITVPVGGSIGFHQHENEEEIFYFISGEGEIDDNGTREKIIPGEAMLTPHLNGHAVYNTGVQPLVLLAVILLYV